jgi:hypothetical protein
MKKTEKIKIHHLIKNKTKQHVFIKFLILLSILFAYTAYLFYEYGFATGGLLAAITWSFFVLCTPIADAGMILDFPIRIIFRLRMFITELMVWTVAILINIYAITFSPEIYENSFLGHIFYEILTQPIPYWSIIILSFFGTFLSIYFADELLDFIQHKDIKKSTKHRLIFEGIIMVTIFLLIFFVYNIILKKFGIDISQF